MNSLFKKFATISAISLALLGAPKKSEAGVGVISLIGGPAGVPVIVAGAGLMIGGSAAVLGVCYVGMTVADWNDDCPIFANFTFWPGLVLLNSQSDKSLALDLMSKYGADQESAERISDRLYNKAVRSAKKVAATGNAKEGEATVVKLSVSLSAKELSELASEEFAATEGFHHLVNDYR